MERREKSTWTVPSTKTSWSKMAAQCLDRVIQDLVTSRSLLSKLAHIPMLDHLQLSTALFLLQLIKSSTYRSATGGKMMHSTGHPHNVSTCLLSLWAP